MSSPPSAAAAAPNDAPEQVAPDVAALRTWYDEMMAIGGALGLLHWDSETKMPRKAAEWRARQKSVVGMILHDKSTSPELDRLIAAVEDRDPDNIEARKCRRDFDEATRLPNEFVGAMAEATSISRHVWQHARDRNDFAEFRPYLERVLELEREKAELLGYETEPYDALHDQYEEGSRAADLVPMFEGLRAPLLELIDRQPEPDVSILQRTYPTAEQSRFNHEIAAAIGYDLDAGRIDVTAHPFCMTVGIGDIRLTTRYDENWLGGALFSTLHEAGHGIYDQGLQRLGLPTTMGSAPGLGMHESQSRMFENAVGRSIEFWEFHFPRLQETFPSQLGDVTLEQFHRAINTAQRSLIRVEADELTYNLHVGLRFELERKLVNGDLAVADLPEAWNDAMQRWLG